jgi:hypothetical protein
MLTGGPSVWYAKRLAPQEQAAILISGYVDEESSGKKLLDLAESKSDTMGLDGATISVRCRVAKFSLSAHADGGELAAYAAALKPRKVALVHGDEEARLALRRLLTETEVFLPNNGETFTPQARSERQHKLAQSAQALRTLPTNIGGGRELTLEDLPELWQTVSEIPSLRIVTARELAFTWYGVANEETTEAVLTVLASDNEQRYFIRQQALEEAYRVRGQAEEAPGDFLSDLVGKILLVEISPGSSKPVLCQSIEPGARIRVQHPRGVDFVRSRYPFSAILDVLGEPTEEMLNGRFGASEGLDDLVKAGRRLRRRLSAYTLARQCQEETAYTLSDMCQLAGVSATALEDRLAIAKILHKSPLIFMQPRTLMEGEGLALYGLAPEWSETLEEPEELPRPDQNWIQEIIQKHLGGASDLYRRGIDPETGEIRLSFHFPAVAQERYATQIEAISKEVGVQVNIAPQPHQGELVRVARQSLPDRLTERDFPSIYHESQTIQFKCSGHATSEEVVKAQHHFHDETGWQLELESLPAAGGLIIPSERKSTQARTDQHGAIQAAQSILRSQPGYVKIGAEPGRWILHARFHFPDVAWRRYADLFAEIEAQTGWQVQVAEGVHQEALAEMARSVLPQGLKAASAPSIYHQQQAVLIQCKGEAPKEEVLAAQERFEEETGWQLTITVPGSRESIEQAPRMAQGEAMAQISAAFRGVQELYRIGVDSRLKIFWLHFHFPEKAGERHAELITRLEQETGWRIYLHPHVHQKALVETAQQLLPENIGLIGKKALLQESRTLHLIYRGTLDEATCQTIQTRFTTETGWQLHLDPQETL